MEDVPFHLQGRASSQTFGDMNSGLFRIDMLPRSFVGVPRAPVCAGFPGACLVLYSGSKGRCDCPHFVNEL